MKRLLILLSLSLLLLACSSNTTPATTDGDTAAVSQTQSSTETVASPAAGTTDSAPAPVTAGAMLQKVKARGKLVCGYHGTLPGFGTIDSNGVVTGFDADFCRAIAAAIFGDPEAVEFRPLNAQERFTALQSGEVDVLVRNTTHTISRDTTQGFDFGPTTFYDGQGMMVRKDSGITSLEEMDGATICVQAGTTTELNLTDNFRARGLEFTPVVGGDADQVITAYDSGQCDGFTTDKSGLVSSQTKLAVPEDHMILDVTMSKEPLAPLVVQGDPQWADIINWTVYATIQAEEFGITQANLEESLKSEDPNVQRFLGVTEELGSGLGLGNDFAANIIRAVGNYGEIYDRNLGPDTPFNLPRGQNSLYSDGGLLYSPPFR